MARYYSNDARQVYISWMAAIGIPAGQSFVFGLLSGFLVGSIALATGAEQPVAIGMIAAGLAALVAFGVGLKWWYTLILDLETAMGARMKPKEQEVIRFEYTENKGRTLKYDDIPATHEQLVEVSRRVMSGISISQGNMLKIFGGSRPDFQEFQGALVTGLYAHWKNPEATTAGMKLTRKGWDLFADIYREAGLNQPPPPEGVA